MNGDLRIYISEIPRCLPDIPKGDEYTFLVLKRITLGVCRLTLCHSRLIICHSASPYPLWVWMPDSASEEEYEEAYSLLVKHFSPITDYRINCKYSFADFLISRAKCDGISLCITKNLSAYNCPCPIPPKQKIGGSLSLAAPASLELATDMAMRFTEELNTDRLTPWECREKTMEFILGGRFYFWLNEDGKPSAFSNYVILEDKGNIGNVYTLPSMRNRGYAKQMVYELSLLIKGRGLIPTLYTDTDYAPSNAAYTAVGFIRRGILCTVGSV